MPDPDQMARSNPDLRGSTASLSNPDLSSPAKTYETVITPSDAVAKRSVASRTQSYVRYILTGGPLKFVFSWAVFTVSLFVAECTNAWILQPGLSPSQVLGLVALSIRHAPIGCTLQENWDFYIDFNARVSEDYPTFNLTLRALVFSAILSILVVGFFPKFARFFAVPVTLLIIWNAGVAYLNALYGAIPHVIFHSLGVVMMVLCIIEWHGGLTVFGRPFEGIYGGFFWLRILCNIIWPCQMFYNQEFNATQAAVLLLLSCPFFWRWVMHLPCAIGGPTWQVIVFYSLTKLPWASRDEKLESFCVWGLPPAVQMVADEVILYQVYDTATTNRLKLYISPISGLGFSSHAVKHLTKRRADPNCTTMTGETLLSLAVKRNNVEAVQYLLQLEQVRHYIDQRDSNQRTSLHHAKSSIVASMLVEAGANAEAPDKLGRTPFMVVSDEAREEISKDQDWSKLKAQLPLIDSRMHLYDLIWGAYAERQNRVEVILHECIIPLIEKSSTSQERSTLKRALDATRVPAFLEQHDFEKFEEICRGDCFNGPVDNALKAFESQLKQVHEELREQTHDFHDFGMPDAVQRLHEDKVSWPNDEWLSQLVAEPIPDWLRKRSLTGALAALQKVSVISTPEQFCDLLVRGQHSFFDTDTYAQYFEDRKSDIFWLALYLLHEIGKTKKLNNHFQAALEQYTDPPKGSFTTAAVKAFKRSMEKCLDYLSNLSKDSWEAKIHCAAEVVDHARNRFQCNTASEIKDLVGKFTNMDGCIVQVQKGVKLRLTTIQAKCGFFKPSKGGWADIKYWILVEQIFHDTSDNTTRVGHSFVAETQLILDKYVQASRNMHVIYACSRGDFNTSKVALQSARKFKAVGVATIFAVNGHSKTPTPSKGEP